MIICDIIVPIRYHRCRLFSQVDVHESVPAAGGHSRRLSGALPAGIDTSDLRKSSFSCVVYGSGPLTTDVSDAVTEPLPTVQLIFQGTVSATSSLHAYECPSGCRYRYYYIGYLSDKGIYVLKFASSARRLPVRSVLRARSSVASVLRLACIEVDACTDRPRRRRRCERLSALSLTCILFAHVFVYL
ncbi:hypothetical protein EVAR_85315_1 [Eumeta japonica]|uniref:Uncharacterized protein n=1 Tax=Eumeta variegata TaxID=151549 RepID=A0A4C1VAB0_EUMVA|nr:hypothetical protein EVAR_85315_1 [Eumeta japonica]